MSENKHTPGPWRYGPASNYEGFFIAPDVALPTLAAVHNFPGQTEANACLIAAAPDLLDAVSESIKQLDVIIADGIPADWQAWRDDLATAYSKAQGAQS